MLSLFLLFYVVVVVVVLFICYILFSTIYFLFFYTCFCGEEVNWPQCMTLTLIFFIITFPPPSRPLLFFLRSFESVSFSFFSFSQFPPSFQGRVQWTIGSSKVFCACCPIMKYSPPAFSPAYWNPKLPYHNLHFVIFIFLHHHGINECHGSPIILLLFFWTTPTPLPPFPTLICSFFTFVLLFFYTS